MSLVEEQARMAELRGRRPGEHQILHLRAQARLDAAEITVLLGPWADLAHDEATRAVQFARWAIADIQAERYRAEAARKWSPRQSRQQRIP